MLSKCISVLSTEFTHLKYHNNLQIKQINSANLATNIFENKLHSLRVN